MQALGLWGSRQSMGLPGLLPQLTVVSSKLGVFSNAEEAVWHDPPKGAFLHLPAAIPLYQPTAALAAASGSAAPDSRDNKNSPVCI